MNLKKAKELFEVLLTGNILKEGFVLVYNRNQFFKMLDRMTPEIALTASPADVIDSTAPYSFLRPPK